MADAVLQPLVCVHPLPLLFEDTEVAPLPVVPTEPAIANLPDAQADRMPALQADERETPSRMARSCANQAGSARRWMVRKAIAADKLNPAHHYLSATIFQEQGRHEIAIQALMRALYLDPDFVLAHFALGNLHQSPGTPPAGPAPF